MKYNLQFPYFFCYQLAGPTDGICMDERLVVTGQNIGTIVPPICGYNTGQHSEWFLLLLLF